jgi:predicted nucleic acid-binding protein
VLLYVYSNADARKQARALAVYREHAQAGSILLSTQVVQEFIVAAWRKLRLPREQVREIAFTLFDSPMVVVGIPHIRTAMHNVDRFQISFWDALIVAAAAAGNAEMLYTEDLNDGQQYGTVLACNPFRQ